MRIFDELNRCSGCTACMNSCPSGAIKMVEDSEGFKYPEIDENICINCGICRSVCPFHKDYSKKYNLETPLVYAVKNRNEDI